MTPNNEKISNSELGIFIFLAVVGIGLLSLPSEAVNFAGNNGWILVILSGGLCILSLFIMCKVGVRHVNLGFVGTLEFLFGKLLGKILAIPVAIYGLLLAALELRIFAEVTKLYLLHRTPLEFIILPMIIIVIFLVRMGIEPITRSFGIFIPIVIFISLALIVFSIQRADYSNLRPFFSTPISKYIAGAWAPIFAFAGYEVIMVLFPYLKEPKKAFKVSAYAILFVIAFFTIIVIQCIAGLRTEETKALLYPVMALTKSIAIPGGFIENVEGLLSSLWVLYTLTSLVAFIFFFSAVSAGVFNHKRRNHFASLSIPIIYILALQGNSIPEVFKISDLVMIFFGTYTIALLPILMLIVSYIRGNKNK